MAMRYMWLVIGMTCLLYWSGPRTTPASSGISVAMGQVLQAPGSQYTASAISKGFRGGH